MHIDPYRWTATLRDGRLVVAGQVVDGVQIRNPTQLPAGSVASVHYEAQAPGWKTVKHDLIIPGSAVTYVKTRKLSMNTHGEMGDSYVVTRSEVALPNGEKEILWMFPNGDTVWHSGTYEELLQARKTAT